MKEKTIKTKTPWNRVAVMSAILELAILFFVNRAPIVEFLQIVVLAGGIISLNQIKKTGERGRWLSILSIFFSGLALIALLLSVLLPLLFSRG